MAPDRVAPGERNMGALTGRPTVPRFADPPRTHAVAVHDVAGLDSPMMPSYDDGMRTIIEIPDEQLRALDAWRLTRGMTRAEAVRRAVAGLLQDEEEVRTAVDSAFGLWRGRDIDGLAEQDRLRAEWDDR